AIDQHGDAPIVLGTRHAPRAVFATNQPPLPVASVPVAVVGWRAKDRHRAGLLAPAQDTIVRNVGEEQEATIAEPGRPLGPARAGPQPLDHGAANAIAFEAGIECFDGRVGIAHDGAVLAPRQRTWAEAGHTAAPYARERFGVVLSYQIAP